MHLVCMYVKKAYFMSVIQSFTVYKWKKRLQKCLQKQKKDCKMSKKEKKRTAKMSKREKSHCKNVCKRKKGLQKPESVQM